MKRNEIPVEFSWDLSTLFKNNEEYEKAVCKLDEKLKSFIGIDLEKLPLDELTNLLLDLEKFQIDIYLLYSYVELQYSVDMGNEEIQVRLSHIENKISQVQSEISYISSSLKQLDDKILLDIIENNKSLKVYIDNIILNKKYALSNETEKVLAALSPAFSLPYSNYVKAKFNDMKFEEFEVDGTMYPLSYPLFEEKYAYHENTKLRRKAFDVFSKTIEKYQHTMAGNYLGYVQNDKIISKLRGFDSVIDYLLLNQRIDRSVYDNHIDTIMEYLSPVMQKYARFMKEYLKLDKMTFIDLFAPVYSEYSQKLTIDEGKKLVQDALSIMGDEYCKLIEDGMDNRWCDFLENDGKATGAFCATPYGVNSFILMTWANSLKSAFTLAHEFGHAGHFGLANKYQNFYSAEPSLYFIEAPSTCNELLLANYLKNQKKNDVNFNKYCSATLISNTYYHNFITHYLEAYFQREVYRAVDRGEMLSTYDLHSIMKDTYKKFWGSSVEIGEYVGYTWMRQPHYYSGLYSYTYSAGLVISTQVYKSILKEGEVAVNRWLDVLKMGGTKSPQELAKIVGIDITKTDGIKETISFIESLVDDL